MMSSGARIKPCPPGQVWSDESRLAGTAAYVAQPESEADVARMVQEALRHGWGITVSGGRTGVSGGAVPDGGLLLDLSALKDIRVETSTALWAGAGVRLADLRAACPPGLFFPPDPTEPTATLGGMAACNASGAACYAYGATRESIAALRVLLLDGSIHELRRDAPKAVGRRFTLGTYTGLLPERDTLSPGALRKDAAGIRTSPGMDLMDLFIGSEGTLGILLAVQVQLQPVPAQRWSMLAGCDPDAGTLALVEQLRRLPDVTAIEYFDAGILQPLREKMPEAGVPPDFHSLLQVEGHGDAALDAIASWDAAERVYLVEDATGIALHRALRHAAPEWVNNRIAEIRRTHPEIVKVASDMAVPPERLPALLAMYRQTLAQSGLQHAIFGHIGDAHLHVNMLSQNPAEYAASRGLLALWAEQVAAWGGTISAEHGIGRLKKELFRAVCPPAHYEELRALKHVFDPDGRLNPGVLF